MASACASYNENAIVFKLHTFHSDQNSIPFHSVIFILSPDKNNWCTDPFTFSKLLGFPRSTFFPV